MTRPIYLDYQATTPVDRRVLDAMLPYFSEHFGNAASVQHDLGVQARDAVEDARRRTAELIGCDRREIHFASGATESNNLALKGLAARAQRRHIVTAATEHLAVLDPLRSLAREGVRVDIAPVDRVGRVDLDALAGMVGGDTIVVSIAAANNEIGTLAPLRLIADIAHQHGALFHSDAAQGVGKIDIDVERDGVDLLSLSSHKVYGPKGVGALYVRRPLQQQLRACIDGGGHERGLRSGTLNVPGIVGFGAACDIARRERVDEADRLAGLRNRFHARLRELVPDVQLNGSEHDRLPGNLNVHIPGSTPTL